MASSARGKRVVTVGWGSPNTPTSLYGSALTLEPSGTAHLVNPLMPSGTTLQQWHSSTDYQALREAPELPLLHHGKTYRVVPEISSVPADTFLLEVRYLDRFHAPVGTEVLYPPEYEFRYPEQCHHYTIRLVNAGCDELRFTSLTLLEVSDE
jgi:accessory secretory protein Asp3